MFSNATRPYIRTTRLNFSSRTYKPFSPNMPKTDVRACAMYSTYCRSCIPLGKLLLDRAELPGLSAKGVIHSVPGFSIGYHSNISKRHFSSEGRETTEAAKKEFRLFYQFPYIVSMRAISRLKIYQTTAMAIFLPVLKHMEMTGLVSSEVFWSFTGLTGFSCTMLYVMSYYFRRLIGLMSLNESEDTLKVSHLTFWGKRNDLYIPVDEIVPLADLEDEIGDIYIKLGRYDSSDYLVYTIRFGYIKDIEAFKKVFGETWSRK